MTLAKERRFYFRHPFNMPIRVNVADQANALDTVDICQGGLCFLWREKLERGSQVQIDIPVKAQHFKLKAQVMYCGKDKKSGLYRTGVLFVDVSSAFKAKLAEEALEILQYRKKISEETGREVSEEEAAREWIQKYAKRFSETGR